MVYDIACHIRFKNKESEWIIKRSDSAYIDSFTVESDDNRLPFFKDVSDAKQTFNSMNDFVKESFQKLSPYISFWNRIIDTSTIQSLYFELCPIPYGEEEIKILKTKAVEKQIGYEVTDEMKELLNKAQGYDAICHFCYSGVNRF